MDIKTDPAQAFEHATTVMLTSVLETLPNSTACNSQATEILRQWVRRLLLMKDVETKTSRDFINLRMSRLRLNETKIFWRCRDQDSLKLNNLKDVETETHWHKKYWGCRDLDQPRPIKRLRLRPRVLLLTGADRGGEVPCMIKYILFILVLSIVLCFLVTALSGNTPPVQTVSDLQRKVFCTAGVLYKPRSANIKLVHRFDLSLI